MLVICNSDRRIDTERLRRGKMFVFGRIQALTDADFIIVTDQHGSTVALHRNEIQWQYGYCCSTFPVKVSHYRMLAPELLGARCSPFERARYGTLAVRDDTFEQYLKCIPVNIVSLITSSKEAE